MSGNGEKLPDYVAQEIGSQMTAGERAAAAGGGEFPIWLDTLDLTTSEIVSLQRYIDTEWDQIA